MHRVTSLLLDYVRWVFRWRGIMKFWHRHSRRKSKVKRKPVNVWKKSKLHWLTIHMLPLLCLPLLLTSCARQKSQPEVVYQRIQIPVVPLPPNLTADTSVPAVPQGMTYGKSVKLNVSLYSALGQCNRDKASIRKVEESRFLAK